MANAAQTQVVVFKHGTVKLMARVQNESGTRINQASVSTVTCSAYLLDAEYPENPDTRTAVTGHSSVSLDKTSCIYDTLQTGGGWSKDTTGYNFSHVVDLSLGHVFGTAGRYVLVKVTITPTSGQPIVFDFLCRVI